MIFDVIEVSCVYVEGLYVSDSNLVVYGNIVGCFRGVDDDDIFGWEIYFRVVCFFGFLSWSRDDVGVSCGEGKN